MARTHLEKRKFETLDALRGIAALLIIMRHSEPFFGISFYNSYLAVDFFFLLSGFVLSHNYENKLQGALKPLEFAKIRFIRLYPLYLLGIFLSLLGFLMGAKFSPESPDLVIFNSLILSAFMLPYLIKGFYLFPINAPAWSLFCEMVGNILYGIFIKWLDNKKLLVTILISGAIFFYGAYFYSEKNNLDIGFKSETLIFGLFRFWFSYGLGILIYRKLKAKQLPNIANNTNFIRICLLLAFVLMLPRANGSLVFLSNLLCVIIAFPIIVYFGAIYEPQEKYKAIAAKLGVISYPIYIMQTGIYHIIIAIFFAFGANPAQYRPFTGLLYLAVLIMTAFWATKFYELPMRNALNNALRSKAIIKEV
jgi:peptidoglycan/LPS O-acetylase OafA/YrhL